MSVAWTGQRRMPERRRTGMPPTLVTTVVLLLLASAPALGSNEVAALCLFPALGIGALVSLASGLVWLLMPLCSGSISRMRALAGFRSSA